MTNFEQPYPEDEKKESAIGEHSRELLLSLWKRVKKLAHIEQDTDYNATINSIQSAVDFKGINMANNQVIEETYGHREPIIHTLDRPMFQGLLSGFQLMNTGSKYRFYFPHQLVTGANGIPPYTPVIYEVELHEIYND